MRWLAGDRPEDIFMHKICIKIGNFVGMENYLYSYKVSINRLKVTINQHLQRQDSLGYISLYLGVQNQ